MKKIIVLIALVIMAATLAAARIGNLNDITITKQDGTIIECGFMYRDDQVFWVKTRDGKTLVLQDDIVTVKLSRGDDITEAFLALDTRAPEPVRLVNASTIAAPLWVMVLGTVVSFIAAVSK